MHLQAMTDPPLQFTVGSKYLIAVASAVFVEFCKREMFYWTNFGQIQRIDVIYCIGFLTLSGDDTSATALK